MVELTSKEERVLDFLRNNPGGNTPKEIAWQSGINKETVKGILRKLFSEEKVTLSKNLRGYYEIVEEDSHGIFNFKFQNCVLTAEIQGYNREIKPVTNRLYSIIKTRLTLCRNTQRATMCISSSHCIDLPALLTVVENFVYAIRIYANLEVSSDNILISSIEFNKDYFNFRLDGVNCVTLSSLIAQYKLYQKRHKVREEFKVTVPIPFPIFNQLLTRTNLHADLTYLIEKNSREFEEIKKCFKSTMTKFDWIIRYISEKENIK